MGSRSKALVSFRSQSASASASAAASAAASFETVRLRFGAEDDDEDPADKEFAAPADLVLLLDEDRERPAVPGRLLLLEEEEVEDDALTVLAPCCLAFSSTVPFPVPALDVVFATLEEEEEEEEEEGADERSKMPAFSSAARRDRRTVRISSRMARCSADLWS